MTAIPIERRVPGDAPERARPRRGWRWSALALPALVAAALAAGPRPARAEPDTTATAVPIYTTTDEYKLKAAYLFNFAKYVEWPAARLPADSAIVIGVLGADPFGSRLDRTVKDRTIGQRPVLVRRARRLADLAGCHILFVCRSERAHEQAILESLRGAPILTVGEGDEFVRRGGMIWLGRVGDAVEFDVNLDAVRGADLAIGARMLGSARHVAGAADGRGR